jgi:hypothetical protein
MILPIPFFYFLNRKMIPRMSHFTNHTLTHKPKLIQNCGGDWTRTHSVIDTRFTVWPGSPTPAHPLSLSKSQWTDSNPRPADYKSAALPTELHWLKSNLQDIRLYPPKKRLQRYNYLKKWIRKSTNQLLIGKSIYKYLIS